MKARPIHYGYTFCVALAVTLLTCCSAKELVDATPIVDIKGNTHLQPNNTTLATVIVFTNTDCPIANAYHPTLKRLFEDYKDDFDFLLVYANPQLTKEEAEQHINEYKIVWPAALDPDRDLQKRFDAKVSPEAFVIHNKGEVLYRGRINDLFADFGKKRSKPTSEDLRNALASIRNSQPVIVTQTQAVGCRINQDN